MTTKYVNGIPADSRIAKKVDSISEDQVTADRMTKVQKLKVIAEARGQNVPQLALAWVLYQKTVATALIGASRPEQIIENVKAIEHLEFTREELEAINEILQ